MSCLGAVEEDLAEMATDQLVQQTQTEASSLLAKRDALTTAQERLGRRFAELNRRGWTFAVIEQTFGIADQTAWRWAKPYL